MDSIVVDTHAHLYDCFDLGAALAAAKSNLARHRPNPGAGLALCLTERHDCFFFDRLREGAISTAEFGMRVESSGEAERIELRFHDGETVSLFAGRQIVTAERLEVLGLLFAGRVPDGLPLHDAIERVIEAGGAPVLCWAPGKWTGARGKLVGGAIEQFGSNVALGLSTLLPKGFPQPALVSRGRKRGLPVLAGSDPLPLAGEERFLGSYATVFEGSLDEGKLAAELRSRIFKSSRTPSLRGRRSGILSVIGRVGALMRSSRAPLYQGG